MAQNTAEKAKATQKTGTAKTATEPKGGEKTVTGHPDYHFIKVVMTDGTEYMTRSTYGKEGDTLNLDIDPNTHPAWTGGEQKMLDRGGRVSRFNTRFAGISFGKK